eukprot:1704922-Pyramimonas_sp.AAC.1
MGRQRGADKKKQKQEEDGRAEERRPRIRGRGRARGLDQRGARKHHVGVRCVAVPRAHHLALECCAQALLEDFLAARMSQIQWTSC